LSDEITTDELTNGVDFNTTAGFLQWRSHVKGGSQARYARGSGMVVANETDPEKKAFYNFLLQQAEQGVVCLTQRRDVDGLTHYIVTKRAAFLGERR
jgi:hypothetical protein